MFIGTKACPLLILGVSHSIFLLPIDHSPYLSSPQLAISLSPLDQVPVRMKHHLPGAQGAPGGES